LIDEAGKPFFVSVFHLTAVVVVSEKQKDTKTVVYLSISSSSLAVTPENFTCVVERKKTDCLID